MVYEFIVSRYCRDWLKDKRRAKFWSNFEVKKKAWKKSLETWKEGLKEWYLDQKKESKISGEKTKHEESSRHVGLWIFRFWTRESYSEFC
jgi:hypothetical protein